MAQWRKQTVDEVYAADEIAARLADELPKWYFEDGWIRRKYKTSGWKSTLMVVTPSAISPRPPGIIPISPCRMRS